MNIDQLLVVLSLLALGLAGLWTVYRVLSTRIDMQSADLNIVRDNYVRRDDFLRVIDRFESKLDEHLKVLALKSGRE